MCIYRRKLTIEKSWWFWDYSVIDDYVHNMETCLLIKKRISYIIFLKITICYLLPRPFGSLQLYLIWYKLENMQYMNTVQLPWNLLCLITGLTKVISNNYLLIFSNLSSSPVVIASCATDVTTFLDKGTL